MSKNVSKLDRDIRKMLIISVVASVAFVAGIPMIIWGAMNNMAVMGIGIAFVVFGFYGMPLLWIAYGNLRSLKRVVDAVLEENLTKNSEIASQLQLREKDVKEKIDRAIHKKYITGFLYNGSELVPNERQKQTPKIVENRCKNCGGRLEEFDNEWRCSYCGSRFSKQ